MSIETKIPSKIIGQPINRVDGRAKVTGAAQYAIEHKLDNVAHAMLVLSDIGRGKIQEIDSKTAERSPGVLAVISYRNATKLRSQEPKERPIVDPIEGDPLPPLQDDKVRFNGQPVAVVVAETLEQAAHAASLVRIKYDEEKPITDFSAAADEARHAPQAKTDQGKAKRPEYERGDVKKGLTDADTRIEHEYIQPTEHHNPIETHATLAHWEGKKLTLYDKSQWVMNVRDQVAQAFAIETDDVRVISLFVGGAFGSALRTWSHVLIAALAAKHVQRPVKLMLTRAQMFTGPGGRPRTWQKVSLGATRDGRLTAIEHQAVGETSTYESYSESTVNSSRMLYSCPNVATHYYLAPMNINTPTAMRAPGEVTGVYALEVAMDELAAALEMDPVELRLRNHADRDPSKDLPWSSKSLKECYLEGAERFGWSKRNPKAGATREGRNLVGYGMASAVYPTNRMPATVRIRMSADGSAEIRSSSSDMGPGTYTSISQVAADTLGLAMDQVNFRLGDTTLPTAPVHGGSMTMASVGSATQAAAEALRGKLLELASGDERSPLHRAKADGITTANGRMFLRDDSRKGESYADILKRHNRDSIEVTEKSEPGEEKKKFSMYAFGAHFVEVHVDADLCVPRVTRVVSGFGGGKIVNPKTARSQAIGGIVGGIGMACLEETHRDLRNGRVINANLADYILPVNADVPNLEVFFIDERDPHVNPLGVKGIAEIALVGIGAAIANAVYHATGIRVRDLPIRLDKLIK